MDEITKVRNILPQNINRMEKCGSVSSISKRFVSSKVSRPTLGDKRAALQRRVGLLSAGEKRSVLEAYRTRPLVPMLRTNAATSPCVLRACKGTTLLSLALISMSEFNVLYQIVE